MESAQNDTRKGVSYTKSFQRQALYAHFLHGVLKGLRVQTGRSEIVFFLWSKRKKTKGQVEQQLGEIAFVFFLFSLFSSSIENQTHISRTSGTSQTNTLPKIVLLLHVTFLSLS
jgi:hypothetical protein